MNTLSLKIFSLLFLLFFITNGFTQEIKQDTIGPVSDTVVQEGLLKNSIFITGGYLVAVAAFTGNYERMLWGNKHEYIQSLLIRIGIGKLVGTVIFSEFNYTTYSAAFGMLLGRKSSFFEIGFGAVYLVGYQDNTSLFSNNSNRMNDSYIYPAGSMGYRYQKPGGNFLFRTGIAYPESLYLSIGLCF